MTVKYPFFMTSLIQILYETNYYLLPNMTQDITALVLCCPLKIRQCLLNKTHIDRSVLDQHYSDINMLFYLFIYINISTQTTNAFIWAAEAGGIIDCVGRLWSAGCHSYIEQFTSIGKTPILIFSLSKDCNISKTPYFEYFP